MYNVIYSTSCWRRSVIQLRQASHKLVQSLLDHTMSSQRGRYDVKLLISI